MKVTLYTSDTVGKANNCKYPHENVITDAAGLAEAVTHDNVCGHFKNDYRNIDNFISCNCIMLDVDNDHSEDPNDWLTPEGLAEEFPDVQMFTAPSRNNMKEKNGKAARSKFHVGFPIEETTDAKYVADLKKAIYKKEPRFDGMALDAARFVFGAPCKEEDVLWQDGWMTIADVVTVETDEDDSLEDMIPARNIGVIPNGQRNTMMSHFAGRVLTRYGDCERAYELFLEHSKRCETPLSDTELNTIWKSAVKFYEKKVASSDGYIPPADYDDPSKQPGYLKPRDYSDIGEARVLVHEYGNELLFTPGTGYMYWDGQKWVESGEQAVGVVEEFLDLQLGDAMFLCADLKKALKDKGIDADGVSKKEMGALDEATLQLLKEYKEAKIYFAFVMQRRDMKYVVSTLQAAKPMLEVSIKDLDANPYLLNTPAGTLDLREGLLSLRPHDARDHITKITNVNPSDEGADDWNNQIDLTFLGDTEVVEYTQKVLGEALIGEVENEQICIAHGEGRNGKSTVFNSCAAVLGSYSGKLSADTLTAKCKRNVKPELAELMGKRLVIAGELEENQRMSTAIVKELCSTDPIRGEKKYKKPFDFIPSHSLILYTNHLPKVGAMDEGIWRRIAVIPFNAKFEGKSEIKNYTNHLIKHSGGAILTWLIEGAKKAYDCDFKYDKPTVVQEAIKKYRADNDWFQHFMDECVETDPSYEAKSGDLYSAYRAYCVRVGDYARSTTDFYAVIDSRGFMRQRRSDGRYVVGLRLIDDTDF